jgi:L-2-hydroxyglutarate oxidase
LSGFEQFRNYFGLVKISMVDDFLMLEGKNSLHVCNAPSPAATASLEIAKRIVSKVPRPGRLSLVKMA